MDLTALSMARSVCRRFRGHRSSAGVRLPRDRKNGLGVSICLALAGLEGSADHPLLETTQIRGAHIFRRKHGRVKIQGHGLIFSRRAPKVSSAGSEKPGILMYLILVQASPEPSTHLTLAPRYALFSPGGWVAPGSV